MKIDLIGMILNHAGKRAFDGIIIDDDGQELDAVHSLDHMIMEYAKVRKGGSSDTVVVPSTLLTGEEKAMAGVNRDGAPLVAGHLEAPKTPCKYVTIPVTRDGEIAGPIVKHW